MPSVHVEQDVDVPESTSDVQMCIQHKLMRAGFQLGVHVPFGHEGKFVPTEPTIITSSVA